MDRTICVFVEPRWASCGLAGNAPFFLGKSPLRRQPRSLRGGFTQRILAVHDTGGSPGQDMGVLEVGPGLDLGQEPVGSDDRRPFWLQHLEGDVPLVLKVIGEKDCRHPALTDLPLDAIAAFQGCVEADHSNRLPSAPVVSAPGRSSGRGSAPRVPRRKPGASRTDHHRG